LGIGIVRALALKGHRKNHDREVRANWLRAGTIFSFYSGSVVGAILFLKVQYYGFYLPAAIACYGLYQAKLENDRQRKREARGTHFREEPLPERIQSPNS
jgi:uncharacterized membrane protein YoaK (UPF0700 family)